ncbi:MAG: hypothetical protein IIY82_02785, partial [Firmicutes bacterium]|nr:hypothetical protein [Bacillota bacterium]
MRKWLRTVLIGIALMVVLLPLLTERSEAATVKVSTLAELREAVNVPHTTVILQADISCSKESVAEISASDVIVNLNGHTVSSTVENSAMFFITGDRVKIYNGTLEGKKDRVSAFGFHGTTKLAQLEDLTVRNTESLLKVSALFETIILNRVDYTQSTTRNDRSCIDAYTPGRILLNDVSIECWNSWAIELANGARALLGNVSIQLHRSNSEIGLLVNDLSDEEVKKGTVKIGSDYRLGNANLKVDGVLWPSAKKLEAGRRRTEHAYKIMGTNLESTLPSTSPIGSVALSIQEPKAGQKPDCEPQVIHGNAYLQVTGQSFFMNDIVWKDITDSEVGDHMDPETETFQSGHTYEAYIYLTPEPGWAFSNQTEVGINGKVVESRYRSDLTPKQMAVDYKYKVPGGTDPVSSTYDIDLTGGSMTIENGVEVYAFMVTTEALMSEGRIAWKGNEYGDRVAFDLDQDGKWDVLCVLHGPAAVEELSKQTITFYKLPSCSVTGMYTLSLSEEETQDFPADVPWFSKLIFRFSDAVNASYKIAGIADKTYTGQALKPAPTVRLVNGSDQLTLKKDSDYTLSYQNNVNAGTATVVVKGKDLPLGTLKKTFKILPVDLAAAATKTSVSGIKASYTATGKAIKPTPTVKALVGGSTKTLKAGTDYTVKYTNNINA